MRPATGRVPSIDSRQCPRPHRPRERRSLSGRTKMWWPMVFLACVASAASPPAEKRYAAAATAAVAAAGPDGDVSILKQINKVNDDGSYTFGYEASDGSFKVETRDVAGNVKGMFGFVDETGRLKRVSYSASNSSGFRTATTGSAPADPTGSTPAGSTATTPSSVPTVPPWKTPDDHAAEPDRSAAAVKKVLVSRRPVTAPELQPDETGRPRDGSDPRRQLSGDDDVPVSPVVSALMSELDPVGASYREPEPTYREPEPSYRVREPSPYVQRQYSISRRAQEEYEPPPPPPQYRQRLQRPARVVYGPDLTALRDELLELILYFVQTRVSRIVSVPTYQPPLPLPPPPPPPPYPMPYQQPNYYVPSYYQGPRMPSAAGFVVRQDGHAEQPSPTVTQTLKDGLIRMLLSTSPRYGPERTVGQPYAAYRNVARSTPVRNVQIVGDDGDADTVVRPVTTETTPVD